MTKLEEVAKAMAECDGHEDWERMPDDDRAADASGRGGSTWDCREDYRTRARAALTALRRPDMAAIMRTAGQIAMRPSDVDLAVTHYLDAILKEPQ